MIRRILSIIVLIGVNLVRTHYQIPEPITGYPLKNGKWEVVQQTRTSITNLMTNPSFETTGLAVGAWLPVSTITGSGQSTTDAVFGSYSFKIVPVGSNSGIRYDMSGLIPGNIYTFSFYIKGTSSDIWQGSVYVSSGGGGFLYLGQQTFNVSPFWKRIEIPFQASSSIVTLQINIVGSGTSKPVYVDGVQVELGNKATTYIDGDQQDCYWNSTPNASSSVRKANSYAGGYLVNIEDYVEITNYVGANMPPVDNINTPYALLDGSLYQRTIARPFTISLGLVLQGDTYTQLRQNRKAIKDLFNPDRTSPRSPTRLYYTPVTDNGDAVGDQIYMDVFYTGGLEGSIDNEYQERIILQLEAFDVSWKSVKYNSTELDLSDTLAIMGVVANIDNAWNALGPSSLGGDVFAMIVDDYGNLYVGGNFIGWDGIAGADNIVMWDGSSWNAVGGGLDNYVYAFAKDSDGNIYVGGRFTNAGGVANADALAVWNGTAWSAVGSTSPGVGQKVYAIYYNSVNGNLFVGGNFVNWAGVADANNIVKYTASTDTWSKLGTGLPDVSTIVRTINKYGKGTYYVGGDFSETASDGITPLNHIAKWDGVSWSSPFSLDYDINNFIETIVRIPPYRYIGGRTVGVEGIPGTQGVFMYNGSTITPLGAGVTGYGGTYNLVSSIVKFRDEIWLSGVFDTAGELELGASSDNIIKWNGSAFLYPNIELPGSSQSNYLYCDDERDRLYIGFGDSGNAIIAGQTTITNLGSAASYPEIVITGPGKLISIRNVTASKSLYFDYILTAGEVATMTLAPGRVSFSSSLLGNVIGNIIRGSDYTTFTLLPGDNIIETLMTDTDGNSKAIIRYNSRYWGVDDS